MDWLEAQQSDEYKGLSYEDQKKKYFRENIGPRTRTYNEGKQKWEKFNEYADSDQGSPASEIVNRAVASGAARPNSYDLNPVLTAEGQPAQGPQTDNGLTVWRDDNGQATVMSKAQYQQMINQRLNETASQRAAEVMGSYRQQRGIPEPPKLEEGLKPYISQGIKQIAANAAYTNDLDSTEKYGLAQVPWGNVGKQLVEGFKKSGPGRFQTAYTQDQGTINANTEPRNMLETVAQMTGQTIGDIPLMLGAGKVVGLAGKGIGAVVSNPLSKLMASRAGQVAAGVASKVAAPVLDTVAGRIATGVGSSLVKVPKFILNKLDDELAQGYAANAMLGATGDIKAQKGEINLSDIPEIAKQGAKGILMAKVLRKVGSLNDLLGKASENEIAYALQMRAEKAVMDTVKESGIKMSNEAIKKLATEAIANATGNAAMLAKIIRRGVLPVTEAVATTAAGVPFGGKFDVNNIVANYMMSVAMGAAGKLNDKITIQHEEVVKAYLDAHQPSYDEAGKITVEPGMDPVHAIMVSKGIENNAQYNAAKETPHFLNSLKPFFGDKVFGDKATNNYVIHGEQMDPLKRWVPSEKEIQSGEGFYPKMFVSEMGVEILKNARKLPRQQYGLRSFENAKRVVSNLGTGVEEILFQNIRQGRRDALVSQVDAGKITKSASEGFSYDERVNIGINRVAKTQNGRDTLDKSGVNYSKELTPKEKLASDWLTKSQSDLVRKINATRIACGKDPIPVMEDYTPFLRKFSKVDKQGNNPMEMTYEQIMARPDMHPDEISLVYKKRRVNSLAPVELDAFAAHHKYEQQALKYIHQTPSITQAREYMKAAGWERTNPEAHRYVTDRIDYMTGVNQYSKIDALPGARRFINYLNKSVGVSTIAYNVSTIASQIGAYKNSLIELGPVATAKGFLMNFDPKWRRFAEQRSVVLPDAMADFSMEDILKEDVHKLKGPLSEFGAAVHDDIKKAAIFGTLPMRVMDIEVRRGTWLAAYDYAIKQKKVGMTEADAIRYADDVVVRTQASGSPLDLSNIQMNPLGKSMTMFQTFPINELNYIIRETAGIGKNKSKAVEAKSGYEALIESKDKNGIVSKAIGKVSKDAQSAYDSDSMRTVRRIIRTGVASAVFSSAYGMFGMKSPSPAPIDAAIDAKDKDTPALEFLRTMAQYVPVVGGGARYGGSSIMGAGPGLIIDTLDWVAGKSGAKPGAILLGKWLGLPGVQQAYKMWKTDKQQSKEMMKGLFNRAGNSGLPQLPKMPKHGGIE